MSDPLAVPLDVKLMNLTASVLFMGCVALVVASGGWWVLRHPAFSIGSLSVQGEFTHNNAATLRANVAHKLMGNFFSEARMLNVAHQYQQATDFHTKWPSEYAS